MRMEQFVLTLSIRTHALASRVTLEQIARQVSVFFNYIFYFFIIMILYSAMSNDDVGMALYKN